MTILDRIYDKFEIMDIDEIIEKILKESLSLERNEEFLIPY
ncbi:MAG: hypothetical protein ACTSPQ_19065 [Candidatus Helarchaeota archaeon]